MGSENEQYKKKLALFLSQKKTLDTFLENGAISRAQYEKSYGDLKIKMCINDADIKSEES